MDTTPPAMADANISMTTINYVFNFKDVADEDIRSTLTIALVSMVFIIMMLATVFGNTVVIIAILTYRQLKKQQSNLFILNLAFADLSVVVTVSMWTLIAFMLNLGSDSENKWIFTTGMCYFQCAMNYCLIVVSMMTLGFISIDRLVHIVYPLRYLEIITVKRIRIMICWTWIQGLIIGFIPVGMQWIHFDYCEVVCAIDWSSKHADKFVIAAFITCFLAPAFTMVICYSIIFKEIKKSMQLTNNGNDKNKLPATPSYDNVGSLKKNGKKQQTYEVVDNTAKNAVKSNNHLAVPTTDNNHGKIRRHNTTVKESTIVKSLLVVVLVFLFCMTPFSVTKLIKVLKGYIPCWVNTFATVIQLLSSACNPLIYGIFRKEYRKAFRIQYEKACHRMHAKFTSSDYTDSATSPYYIDNKITTLQRKELAKRMKKNLSSVDTSEVPDNGEFAVQPNGMETSNVNLTEVEAHSQSETDDMLETVKPSLCNDCKQTIGSPVDNPEKRYSLPRRVVSFTDSPEQVNQTTEIIAL